jgi:hypothetical protein
MQIKLPKGAIHRGTIVSGIAAAVVLAISGIMRVAIPQARPDDDIRNEEKLGDARHLSDADKSVLLARVPKSRKVTIIFQTTASDANDLANEFYDFFRLNGYDVDRPKAALIFGSAASPPKGVQVNLNEEKPDKPVAVVIGVR